MAENLWMYATSRGVGVTLVNPGMTGTAFWPAGVPPFALSPEPVAKAICFALSQPTSTP
ncbi:hypothetical protein [Nonomuraea sp. NPDC049504]|uniref:hypothetical protein n=1 Tax=Nonomuraea sp. NPDC049504 TaxID=3154729 RepID=UPI003413CEBE